MTDARPASLSLVPTPALCYLCEGPAAPGPDVVLRPTAPGPHTAGPRTVELCAPCRTGRPARGHGDIDPADIAWAMLVRDAEELHEECASGRWAPDDDVVRLAGVLARTPWADLTLLPVLPASPRSLLARLLHNLGRVLSHLPEEDPALLPVHRLVEALAAWPARPDGTPAGERSGGRHRKPGGPTSSRCTCGTCGPHRAAACTPSPPRPARHRKPRADDPAPEGTTSLWDERHRRGVARAHTPVG
ncbi:hypothetical protein ACWEPA_32970 [Streptomyces filamentosus]